MKTMSTTDWSHLLSTPTATATLSRFALGEETARELSYRFANTDKAGEFRKLVRTHGATYARRLTRKALRYRGLLS